MPVLSFLFRRIQWYLPGLFGHSGCKVGDFLSFSVSVFISMSLIFIYLPFTFCLSLYFFLFFSPLPLSLFLPLCLFVFLYNFLSSSLSKFSPIFRVVARNLYFLPLFSFLPLCLSPYTFISVFTFFMCFLRFIFPVFVAHVFLPVLSGERGDHFDIIMFHTSILMSIRSLIF